MIFKFYLTCSTCFNNKILQNNLKKNVYIKNFAGMYKDFYVNWDVCGYLNSETLSRYKSFKMKCKTNK